MTEFGKAIWSQEHWIEDGPDRVVAGRSSCADDKDFAPDFGFSGDYRESLTVRPGYKGLERRLVGMQVNVIRATSLEGPHEWAMGDYSKVYSDGSEEPATLEEYRRYRGLPQMPSREIKG